MTSIDAGQKHAFCWPVRFSNRVDIILMYIVRFLSALALAALVLSGTASAGPALLMDAESGKVFYAHEQDRLWHPASTTKLMTAYLTFEALKIGKLKLTDAVLQSERSIKEPPSKIGYPVGIGMSIELALQSLIIKSANDVAVMLAEKIGGSVEGFSARMNRKAKALGMKNTHYVNPNGLHNVLQVTTARDLALLTQALWRDFPEHRARFSRIYMKIGRRKLRSYNSLLRTFDGTDGMKTGFVCASGYNIVASATRDGRRLIAVVLGARTLQKRAARAKSLLSYGFEYFDWKVLLAVSSSDQMLANLPVSNGEATGPTDLRPVVCRPRRRSVRSRSKRRLKSTRKYKKKRSKHRKKRGG